MLVKSVGQQEIVSDQTITEELDPLGDHVNILKSLEMTTTMREDSDCDSFPKLGFFVDSAPTVLPSKFSASFPKLNEDLEENSLQEFDKLKNHQDESPALGSSGKVFPKSFSEKSDLPVIKPYLLDDRECGDGNHKEDNGTLSQMELTMNDDNYSLPKIGDLVESEYTISLGEFLGSFPQLNEDVDGITMQGEVTLKAQEVEMYADRSSSIFVSKSCTEDSALSVIWGDLSDSTKCGDVTCKLDKASLTRMKPMKSTMKHDNDSLPKVGNFVDSGPTFSPCEFLGSIPQLNNDFEGKTLQIEDTLKICEDGLSAYAGSSNFVAKPRSEKCGLPVMEGSLFDAKFSDVRHKKDSDVLPYSDSVIKMGDVIDSGGKVLDDYFDNLPQMNEDVGVVMQGEDILKSHEDNSSPYSSSRDFLPKPVSDASLLYDSKFDDVNHEEDIDSFPTMNPMNVTMKHENDTIENILESGTTLSLGGFPQLNDDVGELMQGEDTLKSHKDLSSAYKSSCNLVKNLVADNCGLPKVDGTLINDVNYKKVFSVQEFPGNGIEDFSVSEMNGNDIHIIGNILSSTHNVIMSTGELNTQEISSHVTYEKGSPSQVEKRNDQYREDVHNDFAVGLENEGKYEVHEVRNDSNLDGTMLVFGGSEISMQITVHKCDQDDSNIEKNEAQLPINMANVECLDVRSVAVDHMLESSIQGKSNSEIYISTEHESGDGVLLPPSKSLINIEIIENKHNDKLPLDESEIAQKVSTKSNSSLFKNYPEEKSILDVVFEGEKGVSIEGHTEVNNVTQRASEKFTCSAVKEGHSSETILLENNEEDISEINYKESSLKVSEDGVSFPHSEGLTNAEIMENKHNVELPLDENEIALKVSTKSTSLPLKNYPEEKCTLDVFGGENDVSIDGHTTVNNVTQVVSKKLACSALKDGQSSETILRENNEDDIPETSYEEASPKVSECSLSSALMADCNAKSSSLGIGESEKLDCVSPTVISSISTDVFQNEKEMQVGKHKGHADLKGNESDRVDKSFTFELTSLADLSDRKSGKSMQHFSSIPAGQISGGLKIEETPHNSRLNEMNSKVTQESKSGFKNLCGRKKKRAPGKSVVKESTKKLNPVQSEVVLNHEHVEQSGTKPNIALTTLTSDLLDLNTLASPTASGVFLHLFTDLQQVQLRAQIFVYGSLIQAAPPEEACMLSAFGISDGGRKVWENSWRTYVERLHGQNILSQSCSSSRTPVVTNKYVSFQTEVISTPVSRPSSKFTNSTVVNSMVSISSPLWNVSTPRDGIQQFTPMQRGSVSDYRQALSPLLAYNTPPQQNFVHTSWLSHASFPGAHFPQSPITNSLPMTPVRESSVSHSDIKHVSSSPTDRNAVGILSSVDLNKGLNSHNRMPKTTKKICVSDIHDPASSQPQTPTNAAIAPGVINDSFTSDTGKCIMSVFPTSASSEKSGYRNTEKNISLSEETLNEVRESKLQAEGAWAHALAAVKHSQEIWTQLEKHKTSELTSKVESALSSAAVTITAAISIAKAAALVARIASNAALQAKLMADEALISFEPRNVNQCNAVSLSDVNNIRNSNLITTVSKEVAQRQVELSLAASKKAENINALVKAAELASEAVSQTGIIVGMGEPLPLSKLLEAGSEGCLKLQEPSRLVKISKNVSIDRLDVEGIDKIRDSFDNCSESPVGNIGTHTDNERGLSEQMDCKVFDSAKKVWFLPVSKFGDAVNIVQSKEVVETLKEDIIKEGSLVEVFKSGDGYKPGWFLAVVLSLKDRKAWLCYSELASDEGSNQLQEWIALDGEGDRSPKIRIARPFITAQFKGTRKRQREEMGVYNLSVGDKVDAWIRHCWQEGVIVEKNEIDENSYTIRFLAQGDTSVVRAWHLRPSLMWKDGEWIEWSSSIYNDSFIHEDDAPPEKRPRLNSPAAEAKEIDKMAKNFDVGKTSSVIIIPNKHKAQTVSRKERLGVIFGVPKPGKRRKFMDAIKDNSSNQSSNATEVSASAKLSKFSMPQNSGSHKNYLTGKRIVESKPGFSKSGKVQNISSRAVAQKDQLSTSTVSTSLNDSSTKILKNIKDPVNHNENALRKQNPKEFKSLGTRLASPSNVPSSKKMPTSNAKFEHINNRSAPSGGKTAKIKEGQFFIGKSTSESIEPRRSNRTIQPTSRLLEGLQSCMNRPRGSKNQKGVFRSRYFKF